MKNHGHKVTGTQAVVPTPPSKAITSTESNKEATTSAAAPSSQTEHSSILTDSNMQSTVVTLIPNGLLNQNSATQLISINGSMLQISNLVSNPLLSSAVISPQGKQSIAAQTDSSNNGSDSSMSSDNGTNRDDDDLLKDDLPIGVKESLSVESEAQCLVVTTEDGKSQDSPLDLSTCTGLQQPVIADDSKNAPVQSLGVKLMPLECVVLGDTK